MGNHIAITKLSTRGQIVIPKEIRELLAWKAGDHVAVELQGEKVILRRLLLEELTQDMEQRLAKTPKGNPPGYLDGADKEMVKI